MTDNDLIAEGWKFHYNLEGDEEVRCNLVYTPYVSPDGKSMIMSFNRDERYHQWGAENEQWTEEMLTDRFNRELKFHKLAKDAGMTVLAIKNIDESKRHIEIEWHGDFLMQGIEGGGYDRVLPNWKSQWLDRIAEMWAAGIYKLSMHPNSWVVIDGKLVPFNWFFSFTKDEPPAKIRKFLVQISTGRLEKLELVLATLGRNLDTEYDTKTLQEICFHSFRANYPAPLIDQALKNHSILA
jgi:hypothetical protein